MKNISKPGLYFAFLWCFLMCASLQSLSQCDPPQGIPTSEMIMWLCPDSAVYNSLGNPASIGDTVYEWHDISGHNWIFENTLNNRRPVLDTANGNTYLKFNPGDFLENIPIKDSINGMTEFSIFAVVKSNVTNTDNGFLYHKNPPDGQDDELCLRYDASGWWTGRSNLIKVGLLGNNGGNQVETTDNTQTTTGRQVITITWQNGGKLYSYLDGIQNDSSDNNVGGPMSGISEILIGKGAKDNNSNEGWDGYIGTLIFYKKQYSSDTIGDISSALPIELLSFNASMKENKVLIEWTTASEINNDFFTIEKSKDGNNFEIVTTVDGAGTSSSVREYSVIDENPYKGVSYYRLKQTDFDGKFSYSDMASVEYYGNANEPNIIFYPNPSNGKSHLKLAGFNNSEEIKIVLRNVNGEEFFALKENVNEHGNALIQLKRQLPAGIYLVTCHTEGKSYSMRVIIK